MNKLFLALLCLLFPLNVIAQICKTASITESTPDSRFSINAGGTVTSTDTGLMWMRCSLGQTWTGITCTGTAITYNWQDALSSGETQIFADYEDWRLPNIKELTTIVELSCYIPTINLTLFPNTQSSLYWSSSPYADNDYRAWIVNFGHGYDGASDKSDNKFVRLVRGGL